MNYTFANRFEGVTGSAIRAIFALLEDPEIISFAGGNPSPKTFPAEALSKIAHQLILERGATILQYGGTIGTAGLIKEVKALLEAEGLKPAAEELVVLTGSTQGIDLLAKAVVNPGDTVLVESPSFLGALQTFKTYQANLVGVEMDEEGILLSDLEEKIKKYSPKFLYVIPTFQNPTGRTLLADRRQKIAELAYKYSMLVLEDDPYGALRFSGEPQPSIKSFDRGGNVVKLMSFSKTVSPGLRVGAAYADKELIAKFNLGKQGQDVHTANLNQMMVAEYVSSPAYLKGVEKSCALYGGKMALMYEQAVKYFPKGTSIVKPMGGMFLWAELPKGLNATELFKESVKRKVAYVPGTHFYAEGGHHHTLRLNFTMAEDDRIEKGMKTLGDLFSQQI